MMITGVELGVVCVACLLIGLCIGMGIWYLYGHPKCEHQWEKIIDTYGRGKRVVVHMCNKCGKRKVTKV